MVWCVGCGCVGSVVVVVDSWWMVGVGCYLYWCGQFVVVLGCVFGDCGWYCWCGWCVGGDVGDG